MKKWVVRIAVVLVLALGAALFFGPALLEQQMNRIDGQPLPAIRADAQKLHDSLTIVDLHSDTLLWQRSINRTVDYGHMDAQRLENGNVALQVLSSVTKTPKGQNYDSNSADTDNITALIMLQLQPVRTWFSLLERALWHGAKLDAAVAENSAMMKIASPVDIGKLLSLRSAGNTTTGLMFSAEGLQSLEGKRENLDRLYAAGLRMAGLAHFFDNDLAGSMHGTKKGGLTPFGRQIVTDMEDKGIIVDIAHCSHKCVAEILVMARRPVVSSHGGVQAVCKVNRNLSDAEIRGLAATGGIIGLGYWDGAMCDTDPASVAKSAKHIRDLVGIDHVALGSDFDGATTTRIDTGGLVHITQALIDIGFTESEIRAVMGGNAVRVLRQGLVPYAVIMPEKAETPGMVEK